MKYSIDNLSSPLPALNKVKKDIVRKKVKESFCPSISNEWFMLEKYFLEKENVRMESKRQTVNCEIRKNKLWDKDVKKKKQQELYKGS